MHAKFTLSVLAILLFSITLFGQTAVYDTVSIRDINFVTDPNTNDDSPLVGDTVVVKALMMNFPRDFIIGARWGTFIIDPDSFPNPWSGMFVIQNDTVSANALQTNFGFLEPGVLAYFTGVVSEFPGGQASLTQLNLLTDPVVPVDIISAGNTLPEPVLLTCADISLTDVASGEQWEGMLTRIENATVVNNSAGFNRATIDDGTGQTYIGAYFSDLRNTLNGGTYEYLPTGTTLEYVIGYIDGRFGNTNSSINPPDSSETYIKISVTPPAISAVSRTIGVPTTSDNVGVSADIVDADGTITASTLKYSVDFGAFQDVPMSNTTGNTFAAEIPAQAEGAFVRYFITATDNSGNISTLPADTSQASGSIFFYNVTDGLLNISNVQFNYGYPGSASGYEGFEVTLQGVVMTDPTDFIGEYFIEDKDSAWSAIWVIDGLNTFDKGDLIQVTGTVQENFGMTRINLVTASQVVTPGVGVFAPVLVTTGEMTTGGASAEAFESVFVRLEKPTVTDPFPDSPNNFGEFVVDDGTGGLRIDDLSDAFNGNQDSTYTLDDTFQEIQGFGYFSFGNAKVIPRDSSDIIGHVVVGIEDDNNIPRAFELAQNFPNPFNPSTNIRYSIRQAGIYQLTIYNILGQRVQTLFNGFQTANRHEITWNGLNEAGNPVGSGIYFYQLSGKNLSQTKKMILLR